MLQQPHAVSMRLERDVQLFRQRENLLVIFADPLAAHLAHQFRRLGKAVGPGAASGAVAGFEHGDIPSRGSKGGKRR